MQTIDFFVGTYTQAADHVPNPKGEGIVACRLDITTGEVSADSEATKIENPAWLHWQNSKLYAAYESFVGESALYQFNVESNQSLSLQCQTPCSGISVCHLVTHAEKLYSAAYQSGQLDVHGVSDGLPHLDSIQYQGTGPNLSRQESAHAHHVVVSPEGRWLYVCDLGSDCIWRHDLHDAISTETSTSKLSPAVKISAPAGSGPRHMVFHPTNNYAYLLTELSAELVTIHYDEKTGNLDFIDRCKTLPTDYEGTPSAAGIAIHPNGGSLYYSNRGHDSITCYSIDSHGMPKFSKCVSSGGLEPRAISVDPTGQWLLVANQNSNSIVTYKLNVESGALQETLAHSQYVGTPVCISFKT